MNCNKISFALLTSGKKTTIVKSVDEDYDQAIKSRLYDALQFNDSESNLSEAVLYTSLYLESCASSGTEKSIFILTDGYPSSPRKLRRNISFSRDIGIQTIALGIGYFTDGIFEYFPNYVVVNNPKDLPEALRGYYCREPSPGERHGAIQIESVNEIKKDNKEMDLKSAWKCKFPDVYKKEIQKLNKALYLASAPMRNACIVFQVDLCFVLDTTGSMSGMIKMAKEKIKGITESIEKCVKSESDREANVRIAFVGYKIKDQDGNLDNVPFTQDTKKVLDVVSRQQAKGGSKGGVEDKYEALEMAYGFEWTGIAKFLVLIADAPGHGEWCTGRENIKRDNYPERAQDMPGLVSKIAKKGIYLFYVNIKSFTDHERNNFKKQYIESAPNDMKEKGFQELKIDSPNHGEKLANMIGDQIKYIIIADWM